MLEFEAWWLLAIPLFFGLGWFASRYETGQAASAVRRDGLPDAYFRGLNFLLNEQSDKAIDAFIDVVRVDPETIELHFALGNLFRRRGETDRAIRVHQNLVERDDLDAAQREQALFELGQDYLKAGLLDRAEDAFKRLSLTRYGLQSLQHRLEIAQMVRDWPQAIELAERLQRELGENRSRAIAHFRCELAAQALAGDSPKRSAEALQQLELAVRADPRHPRPALLRGELALAEGRPQAAIDAWKDVQRANPAWLALVAQQWLDAFSALGQRDEGIDALEQVQHEHPSIDTFAALVDARSARDGGERAVQWAEQALRASPSLLGLDKLLSTKATLLGEGERTEIELAQQLIQAQARRLSRYVCSNCGFKASRFYWQCPGCNRWDTYAPKRSEELERG
ncbi:MAG: lipopolysaccharide assembly protein LapB [Burkholderiaceae bacterium]|jgi:lipopolysaccharide biosynthesis regulator YciM|nr:lipopolysaccharide assembly protein LapB [Burkholderiaceae bacterium]